MLVLKLNHISKRGHLSQYSMAHGAIIGSTILVSPILVESLQLDWRFHLQVHYLQMACTHLAENRVQGGCSSYGLNGDLTR